MFTVVSEMTSTSVEKLSDKCVAFPDGAIINLVKFSNFSMNK